jgi:hypothetical protein
MHALRCLSRRNHIYLGSAQAGLVKLTPFVLGLAAGCGDGEVAWQGGGGGLSRPVPYTTSRR